VELLWNGGSAVGVSSSEFTRGGGDVLRVRGRERARGRVDCDAGSPGVLRRAQDGRPGCCAARATAAARWQPRGASGPRRGSVARGGGSSAMARAVEEALGDAWATARRKKAAGKPLHGAGVGAVGGRRRGTEQRGGDGNKGRFVITKNSRDPTVKQR